MKETKNIFRKSPIGQIGMAAMLLMFLIGSVSAADCGAGTAKPNCECGDTVVGDYTFTADLTCTDTTKPGLEVGADDITIDGAGYKITGSASAVACADAMQTDPAAHSGIRKSADVKNTMIKDLEIVGFCTGIGIEGAYTYAWDDYNTEVTGCVIHDNGDASSITHGVHLTGANKCTITKNEIYNQDGTAADGCGDGGNGISMHGVVDAGGDYNTITCNYLHDNAKDGFHMKFKCMHNIISNNKVTGNGQSGIKPECKKSDWNTFEYNYIADNGPYYGFYTRGSNNVIRYNTVINTKGVNGHYYGIYIGTAGMPLPFGRFNNIADNTVCGSQAGDIKIEGTAPDADNTVDDNTCDASSGGSGNGCSWNCDNKVPVYYDFDEDNYYSQATCTCGNILSVGACCNPGEFASDGVSNHCAGGVCTSNPGTDPTDCDASVLGTDVDYYCDEDEDGYIRDTPSGNGAPGEVPPGCELTPGDDCDDSNADVNPGATEDCSDGIDNDCDGLIDMNDPDCGSASLYVSPQHTVVVASQNTFTVKVNISGNHLMGASFDLFFDSSVIKALKVEEGDFIQSQCSGTTFSSVPPKINNAVGEIEFQDMCLGSSINGEGDIAEITFRVLSGGTSELDIGNEQVPDANGNLLSVTETDGDVTVHNPPVAVADAHPTTSCDTSYSPVYEGINVGFDGIASYDLGGSIVSYLWDFGDGSSDDNAVVNHNYARCGDYYAMLTVTDNEGVTDSDSLKVEVDLPGDLNSDDFVDIDDLIRFAAAWGTGCADSRADITGGGNVDVSDLAKLAANWERSC
ncbi:MAG: right-handed parallel beta-helix repeat-containing protein [Candidatus Altiarchaeota archaeon]|nr:right-handed parallel beta-helix repeat-containing protein [Candidatus Altiarchaeota archaeon]